ncbi:MAG TPA: hypothetical protein VGD71_07165 [Kribbella sp.]|jgi:hypothetical protein
MPKGTRRRTAAVTAAAVAVAAIAGWSLFGSDTKTAEPKLGYPWSWIWYTTPNISLQAPAAITVRAWVESATLYDDTGESYPGFPQATSPGLLNGMLGAQSQLRGGGTNRYLIRSLTVRGDELHASLCYDGWDEFGFDAQGNFVDAGLAIGISELIMHKGGASPSASRAAYHLADPSPSSAGRVPAATWLRGPTQDVFDGWVATSWEARNYTPDCAAWFKRNHPGLDVPTGYTNEERPNRPASPPPPTLQASPGW